MKSLIAILLTLCLAFSLVGCGNNDEGQLTDPAQQSEQPTAEPQQDGGTDVQNTDGTINATDEPAAPVVQCQTASFSGLTFYLPEGWTYSEFGGVFSANSRDYYNDLGMIISMRDSANVPTISSDGSMTPEQINQALSPLISESEIEITSRDYNATLGNLPAVKMIGKTDQDGLTLHLIFYVTTSTTTSNFVLAGSSLNYADIELFDSLFGFTQVA